MKDISQTIPFNINNTIACKRFMEAKIDGILIILGRKMRLIWLCFIVTSFDYGSRCRYYGYYVFIGKM